MALNDVYRLSYDQTLYGQKITNVFHYEQTSPETSGKADELSLADAFIGVVVPLWQPVVTDDWQDVCIRVQRILPGGGVQRVRLTAPNTGTVLLTQAFAPNVTVVTTFYTDDFSKTGRGRYFLSGFPTTGETLGLIKAAERTLLSALGEGIAGDLTFAPDTGVFSFRVYSKKLNLARVEQRLEVRTALRKLRPRSLSLCDV